MLTFGEEVKRLALEKGLSQTAIAEACGVRSSFISKLMLGQRGRLGADVFLKLASVLGVSCEYLRPFLLADDNQAEEPTPAPSPTQPPASTPEATPQSKPAKRKRSK